MSRSTLLAALGLAAVFALAGPAAGGGGGPVSILKTQGTVRIRPVDFKTGAPGGRWRAARPGGLIGSYLLRTRAGSFAHINMPFRLWLKGRWEWVPAGCIDAGSLVRIDSYADSTVTVLRGRISRADGKRGARLPDRLGSL